MALGTGIFMSALLLAVVFLFHTTKDRWNWRKIFKFVFVWPLVVVIGLSAIGGGGYYLYGEYEDRPRVQTGLWGLELGMSKNDVLFAKGDPKEITTPDESKDSWYETLMEYEQHSDSRYYIFLIDEKVVRIAYWGDVWKPSVNGLEVGDSIEGMVEQLGKSASYWEYSEGKSRQFKYPEYNSVYWAAKGKIVGVGVLLSTD